MKGKLITRALGEWPAVSIADATAEAHKLRGMTETGVDPREIEREQQAAIAIAKAKEATRSVTVRKVWAVYIEVRCAKWGEPHHNDHHCYPQAGGEPKKRGKGSTEPRPLSR